MSWIDDSGQATMSRAPEGYTDDVQIVNKWVVRTGQGNIICIEDDYDVAVAVWHRELDKADNDCQLILF